jgi:hypothetical protein
VGCQVLHLRQSGRGGVQQRHFDLTKEVEVMPLFRCNSRAKSRIMSQNFDIFDLPEEWVIRNDPRESLFNDFRDQIRTAQQTLEFIVILDKDGLLPRTASQWWREFVQELIADMQSDRQ